MARIARADRLKKKKNCHKLLWRLSILSA